MPTCSFVKPHNSTDGFWKTFRSPNPRCRHCGTPTQRLIGGSDRRRDTNGIMGALAAQNRFSPGRDPVGGSFPWRGGLRRISCSWRSNWRCWICTQTRCRLSCWLPRLQPVSVRQRVTREDGTPIVHRSADATNLAGCLAHSVLPGSRSSWPRKKWKGSGGSGDRFGEEARPLPLIGTCQDSRCFVEKAHMVHAHKSDASLFVYESGAIFDTSRFTGHGIRRAGAKRVARLRLPSSGNQFCGRWRGMSVLAFVEEAMEESEDLLGLDTLGKSWQINLRLLVAPCQHLCHPRPPL